jgi:hypothetical protein
MASDANKFTDQHVRMRPDLRALAVQYALEYTGEFEPLVRANIWAENNGELSIPTARMVLNCMRHDLNVAANLPDPYGLANGASPGLVTSGWDREKRRLAVVPEYKAPVKLKVEFKYGYLVSTRPVFPSSNPPVGHILNHSRSVVQVEHGKTIWYLKAWCGWAVNNVRGPLMAEVMEKIPEGRRACRGCNKLLLKAGMEGEE